MIPGILGSKLVDHDSGRVVWGAFAGDYANPKTADGARLIALPMREGAPLAELQDDVEPHGVLDRVRVSLFGLPFERQAYLYILATLGSAAIATRHSAPPAPSTRIVVPIRHEQVLAADLLNLTHRQSAPRALAQWYGEETRQEWTRSEPCPSFVRELSPKSPNGSQQLGEKVPKVIGPYRFAPVPIVLRN